MPPQTPGRLLRTLRVAIKSRIAMSLFGVLLRAQCDPGFSFASKFRKPDAVLRNLLFAVAARAGTLKPLTDRINSRLQFADPLRNFREIPAGMPFEIPQLEISGAILPGDFPIDGEATRVLGEPSALIDRLLWQKIRGQFRGRLPPSFGRSARVGNDTKQRIARRRSHRLDRQGGNGRRLIRARLALLRPANRTDLGPCPPSPPDAAGSVRIGHLRNRHSYVGRQLCIIHQLGQALFWRCSRTPVQHRHDPVSQYCPSVGCGARTTSAALPWL
jgi:hypothetical protein